MRLPDECRCDGVAGGAPRTGRTSARLLRAFACAFATLAIAGIPSASAAQGLDPTFGVGGLALSPPGSASTSYFLEVDASPDGSALVSSGGNSIVRFGEGGDWDGAFADSGVADLPEESFGRDERIRPHSVALDGEGRILVFGEELDGRTAPSSSTEGREFVESEAAVLRFEPDGSPDPTFGGDGLVHYAFSARPTSARGFPTTGAVAGTVDSQDRPVLAVGALVPVGGCYAKGEPGVETRALARLTETGLRDPTFGQGGVAPASGTTSFPYLGLTTGDRPILDVGPTGGREPECRRGSTVLRFDRRGHRLRSFGDRGEIRVDGFEVALSEPSGATILTRYGEEGLELRRRGPRGGRDSSFGRDGVATLTQPRARHALLAPVAVDDEGRILMAGSIHARGPGSRSALVVGRLLPDGRPDPDFGEGGWIFTPLSPGSKLEGEEVGATLDDDGRLLLGTVIRGEGESLAGYLLARYLVE